MLGIHKSLGQSLTSLITESSYAETFQFFLSNPRSCRRRDYTTEDITVFNQMLLQHKITSYVIHAPFTLNPASPDAMMQEKCRRVIQDELDLLQYFAGRKYYVLHPGSHKGTGPIAGLTATRDLLRDLDPHGTTICVETMAGAGTEVLVSPEEVEYLAVTARCKMCFDSAHVFESGWDPLWYYERYKDYFAVVHLNNSATMGSSRHDIHAPIQRGFISDEDLKNLYQEVPANVPVILETPTQTQYLDFQYLTS